MFDDDMRTRNLLIRTYVEKPPVLWIVAGQSNAVGSGGAPSVEVADYAGQYWDWSKISAPVLRPLRDPVYRSYNKSSWPAFGREFFALTGRKVVILNVAWGGAYVTNYGGDNTWYGENSIRRQSASTQYQALTAELGKEGTDWTLGGLLWIQGEAEASGIANGVSGVSVSTYLSGTQDVFAFFRSLTGNSNLPIYISQIGAYKYETTSPGLHAAYESIREAQKTLVNENQKVFMAFDGAETFLRAGYMYDNIHYNQKGYNIIGKAFARFISNNQTF